MTIQPTTFQNFSVAVLDGLHNSTNSSGCPDTEAWNWVYAHEPAYIAIICALGILLNLFVLIVFCFHNKPCTVAEIFLGNLAAADLILVCCLPFWAVNIANNFNWPFGQFMCKVVNVGIKMNVYCSTYFLVLVSIDRYIALVHGLSHGRMRRPKYAKLSCVVTWGFGLLLSIPAFIFREVEYFPQYGVHACYLAYPSRTMELFYNGTLIFLSFMLPISIISFCTWKIIRALKNQAIDRFNAEKTEQKATILVLVVLLVFLFCWVPFHLVTMLDLLFKAQVLTGCVLESALDICNQFFTYLGFFNSVLNPILYVVVGKNFRKKVQELLKQWSSRRRTTFESTRSNVSSTLKTLV
ncbi:hypothetical protein OJAV_G00216110 [Oryzias javanicus]|uniref:B2 bradykinin receptor n=1 Tax=Oryzias javanicus TaxID=123683 RepID=A0A3S2NVF6_ORYJA|nr:hypothetical protein OJAV_G00216110 [Oryzias javanicus]